MQKTKSPSGWNPVAAAVRRPANASAGDADINLPPLHNVTFFSG